MDQLAGPGVRVVVLFFASTDCPICNRTLPEVVRLSRQFPPAAARFWWVYPNPQDTATVVAQHHRDFGMRVEALLDTQQKLVALARVTTTPEAAVFVVTPGGLREVYHGRIDDRYLSLGEERPQPQHHDLEEVIAAALAGKPIPKPVGRPVGCAIIPLQP